MLRFSHFPLFDRLILATSWFDNQIKQRGKLKQSYVSEA